MRGLIGHERRDIPPQFKDRIDDLIATLQDVKLVEDPPESGWFEFADAGMLPFLQGLHLGYSMMIGIHFLSPDDPLWQTLYWCSVHLTAAQGHWEDSLGRLWSLEQLRDANALIRRADGVIQSVSFPIRINEAGNVIYPPDRTAEHVAERKRSQAPEDPATGEPPDDSYNLFS